MNVWPNAEQNPNTGDSSWFTAVWREEWKKNTWKTSQRLWKRTADEQWVSSKLTDTQRDSEQYIFIHVLLFAWRLHTVKNGVWKPWTPPYPFTINTKINRSLSQCSFRAIELVRNHRILEHFVNCTSYRNSALWTRKGT